MATTRSNMHSLILVIGLLCCACTGTRYLPEGQTFYEGAEINFETKQRVGRKKEIARDLETFITPKPNGKFLGMRPGVWFYYIAGTPKKKKGLRNFIKNKLGQPPVLFSEANPQRTAKTLTGQLWNEGYFQSEVTATTKTKRKATTVIYTVELERPYRLDTINYPRGRDSTYAVVFKTLYEKSLLKPNQRYRLARLQAEQIRIEKALEDFGFYYFDDRYLIFEADSTVGDRKVSLDLRLEKGIPSKARRIYTLDNVNIFPNYTLSRDTTTASNNDTTHVEGGYTYIDNSNFFRPEIITRVINLKKGERYSREAQELTLSHLMGLGTFKFVNIKFRETYADSTLLTTNIYLTPLKKKSLRAEAQAVSKSNNFVGPGLSATFTNRNFLRGAELFQFKLNTAYEVQLNRKVAQPLNSFEAGVETSLTVPRFISPIRIDYTSRRYLPKTQIKAGYSLQNRVQYFRINSFNAAFGYNWRETAAKTHELFIADISYVRTDKKSQVFEDLLADNPALRGSFENQFIAGTRYSFTLNTQLQEESVEKFQPKQIKTHNFYFNGSVNTAGNLLNALRGNSSKVNEDGSREIFGAIYSQFVRGDLDFRHYWQLDRHQKIASRIVLGAGYAYGNTSILPYVKQFSIGGTNSIRAFPARSIGPGTYQFESESVMFIDQRGDVKMEGNVEYRFDIVKSLKGAVFMDAGNIWLWNEDTNRPGGELTSDFLRQLAVGTGAGLRIDFSFFILRCDVAFPLRRPTGWVARDINFSSSSWRGDNLVFNIAIGYPF